MTFHALNDAPNTASVRLTFVSVLATICGLAVSIQAWSQETMEEVVVKGYRSSLRASMDLKKESSTMVDSIVAEDIGDFPESNLAEAISRVPGVTITYDAGRGKNVVVRGLNSTFTRTLLNGMEAQAVDFNTRNRSFDFNIFASELFSRIDIKKSTEAKLEEGSLGATIELYTARPLDYDDNQFMVGAELGHNSNAGDSDPRIVSLFSMKNDAETFGAAFSVAWSDTHTAEESHNSGRWEANTNVGLNTWGNAAALPAEINDAYHPRFPRYYNNERHYKSLGITTALQWKPSDRTLVTLDYLHSKYDWTSYDPALTPISMSRTGSTGRIETTVNDYTYDPSNNSLVYADLSGVDIRSESVDRDNKSDMDSFSLTLEQDIGDRLHLHALVGTVDAKSQAIETLAILEAFNQDFTYDYSRGASHPEFTYGFDLTDPASWLISESRYLEFYVDNTYDTARVDLSWDVNDALTFTVGLSQKDYEYDLLAANRNLNLHGDPQGIVVVPPGCGIQQSDIVVTADQGFVRKDWQGQEYFLIRWDAFADALGFPGNGNTAGDPCFEISPGSSGRRNVKESDFGYYAQMDFHTQLGTMDFFGNVGLRNVTTDVDSTGDIATEPVTVKKSYSDSLPSMNLGLWVTDEVVLRAAWAKVMARPDLGDISPGGSVDGFNRRYTAGNPGLEPFRADAFDLAVEWYFGEESLLSLAFFQKDIASFPEQVTETVTWQSLGLPDSLLDNSPATPQDLFDYTAKQTGAGGTLHGLELQLQTPFAFGPAWFQDFGTRLSYTDITSDVEYGTTRGRLLNQSDTAYNFTLWYENDSGFAGRVTFSHIGDSATRIPSRFTIPGGVDAGEDINAALDYVSAKFSYQINEQLSVSLEGLNLTDERTHSLMGSNGFLLEDTSNGNGPQYFIGAQYFFR